MQTGKNDEREIFEKWNARIASTGSSFDTITHSLFYDVQLAPNSTVFAFVIAFYQIKKCSCFYWLLTKQTHILDTPTQRIKLMKLIEYEWYIHFSYEFEHNMQRYECFDE